MKQGILNVQPLLVSIVEKYLEQSIPYGTTSDVQASEPKRKYERLVKVVTTKTKRVKQQATSNNQQATRLGKRQKTFLKIVESSEEEEAK